MSAGLIVDRETTRVLSAGGRLVAMVIKRTVSRSALLAVADDLQEASDNLRRIAGKGD